MHTLIVPMLQRGNEDRDALASRIAGAVLRHPLRDGRFNPFIVSVCPKCLGLLWKPLGRGCKLRPANGAYRPRRPKGLATAASHQFNSRTIGF